MSGWAGAKSEEKPHALSGPDSTTRERYPVPVNRSEDQDPTEPDTVREPPGPLARALDYASKFFMGKADVQQAARRLAERLDELQVPYALVGGLAVAAHGHVRVTMDVDVLLTGEGLTRFKDASLGLGWVEKFRGSKGVRDVQYNVPIDVILTGEYPGDGEVKPIRFPDPADVAVPIDGMSVVSLPVLIELKLTSGMSAPDRLQDLADVIELVRANSLPRNFCEQLDGHVVPKFEELWEHAQRPTGEY